MFSSGLQQSRKSEWSIDKRSFLIYIPALNSVLAGFITLSLESADVSSLFEVMIRIWVLFWVAYAINKILTLLWEKYLSEIPAIGTLVFFVGSIALSGTIIDQLLGLPFRFMSMQTPAYGGLLLITLQFIALQYYRQSLLYKQSALVEEAARQAAELKLLKSQNNPHFIFNTINLIISTVPVDPYLAQDLLHDLSTYLRKSVSAAGGGNRSVEKEVDLTRSYLNIIKQRFLGRFSYEISVHRDCYDVEIPPLVFQSVIENAVKFGVAKISGESHIFLSISRSKDQLIVSVINQGRTTINATSQESLGLKITEAILKTEYGDAYKLTSTPLTDGFRVDFLLPLKSQS